MCGLECVEEVGRGLEVLNSEVAQVVFRFCIFKTHDYHTIFQLQKLSIACSFSEIYLNINIIPSVLPRDIVHTMSSSDLPSQSPNIKLVIMTQPYEELTADFYDQFLTFDCDVDEKYTNISPSAYLDNASTVTSSISEVSAYRRPSTQHLPLTTPTTQSQIYNEMMEFDADLEGERLKHEYDSDIPYSSSPQEYNAANSTGTASANNNMEIKIDDTRTNKDQDTPLSFLDLSAPINSPQQLAAHKYATAMSQNGLREHGSLTLPLTCKVSDISPDLFQIPQRQTHMFPEMSPPRSFPPAPYPTPYGTPNMGSISMQGSRHASLSPRMPVTPKSQMMSTSFGLANSPPSMNYRAGSTYTELDDPLFWDDLAISHHTQGTPNLYHLNPQRATKALALQLQNDMPYNNNLAFNHCGINSNAGLMIDMPQRPRSRTYPSMHRTQRYASATPPLRPMHSALPYHPAQMRRQEQEHRYAQERQQSARRARHQQQQQQHRQQSTTSDTDSSCSKSPNFQLRKRRTPKVERKASTARSSASESGNVEFMNYTPDDSMKILNGVAPSGSSKTKARREKEALDKRMKLSQAALRAVRAAGGDPDCLFEEGLFV